MCSKIELPCPLCDYPIFPSVESLRISLVNVTNRQLLCPICNEIIFGLDKLTIHLFSHTILCENRPIDSPGGVHRTSTMEASTTNTELIAGAGGVKNECEPVVGQSPSTSPPPPSSSSSSSLYRIEVKSFANSNNIDPDPECDICSCTFRTMKLKEMHMKLVHEITPEAFSAAAAAAASTAASSTAISGGNNFISNNRLTDDSVHFQCHLCSKQFKMKGSLRVHLRVVHSIGLKSEKLRNNNGLVCGERLMKSDSFNGGPIGNCTQTTADAKGVVLSGSTADPKLWECEVCTKSFTTKYFLKKHKRLHTGEMPYTCEVCGKTFTFQQSYHKHLLYHNDDKPHTCTTCGRAFKELSTLHNHERIHSGEKPFKCETCDKCFRQRVSYLVHRRIHTGVMPYRCTACDKSFRYKVSQRTHKCEAQPPGMVVRQKSDLLSRLLQQSLGDFGSIAVSNALNEDAASNGTGGTVTSDGQIIDDTIDHQSLDDLVAESCTKLGIVIPDDVRIPASPSERFQHLCLYTPGSQSLGDECDLSIESINESTFKDFMFESNI